MRLSTEEAIEAGLVGFLEHYSHLDGDEKGEAQVFLDRLFRAFGHVGVKEAGAVLEDRIRAESSVHFADLVWDGVVLIEMKKRGEDLRKHYAQAERYWTEKASGRPRYVVTCNFDEFWIYDFEVQMYQPIEIVSTVDLPSRWEAFGFMLPKPVQPLFSQDLEEVSKAAAESIATMVTELIASGVDRQRSQRFAMQCVTAMFAEDTKLIPRHLFTRAVKESTEGKADSYDTIFALFREMDTPGRTPAGRFEGTPYFNGDLYSDTTSFELPTEALVTLLEAANQDWARIQPEIFGTLFERFLDDEQRHAQGAHFTTAHDIMRIVGPTIVEPFIIRIKQAKSQKALGKIETELTQLRIIDPACGSGNFLYVAYRELRKLETLIEERRSKLSEKKRSKTDRFALVSPKQFFGIDIDPFAVEIARVTLLIAKQLTAYERGTGENPLPLDNLDNNIVVADALLDGWPEFDICIGNPPYLGRQRMLEEYGAEYLDRIEQRFPGVSGFADYVTYWFRLAHERMPEDGRAGFVATNTVRQGASRVASLDYIIDNGGRIVDAWASVPWSGEAGVYFSIVNWVKGAEAKKPMLHIHDADKPIVMNAIAGDLSPGVDLRSAASLRANSKPKVFFQGQTTGHMGFVLSDEDASRLQEAFPEEEEAIHPYVIGEELLHEGRPTRWVIDIEADDATEALARFPGAIRHLENTRHVERGDDTPRTVREKRSKKADEERAGNEAALSRNPKARVNWHHRNFLNRWWQHSYRRTGLLDAVANLDRYIIISRVASEKRRPIFVFVESSIHTSDALQCFAFDDDFTLGILQSRAHELWFRRRCSTLEERLRYTTKTVFGSFPWPQDMTDQNVEDVVSATKDLLDIRERRLADGMSLAEQYNSIEQEGRNHLRAAQQRLDNAVLNAYGFKVEEDEVSQLLYLNQQLAARQSVDDPVTGPGPAGLKSVRATNYMIRDPRHS